MAQKTKKIKKILSSKIFLFIVVFILIFLLIGLIKETYRKHQLTSEINELKSNIDKLEGDNQQLVDLMDYFKEDSYLEKEARIKLNLKKPGETVVVLSKDVIDGVEIVRKGGLETEENNKEVDLENNNVEVANYWKWWEYFFLHKRD